MDNAFERTEKLLGSKEVKSLAFRHIALFGVGGVGGYALEALVRSGVGKITVIDNDTVAESNLNRQILATTKTLGEKKTAVAAARAKEINPEVIIIERCKFFSPETANEYDFSEYDYIIDAIDTVTAKIELAVRAKQAGVPIISCMGTGNKLDPTAFEIADIYSTSVCPLARVMRRELKKRNIESLKVLYSKEEPISVHTEDNERKVPPASVAFVPSVAGLIIASEVIKDLIK